MQIIAASVELWSQSLSCLLRVLKFHVEQFEHEVGEIEQEYENLFLTRTEQDSVSLVECQIGALQHFQVFLDVVRVATQAFYRQRLDGLPHATLVVPADGGGLVRLERVPHLLFRVVRLGPSALLPLALDLVQTCDVFIKLHEAKEGEEAGHDRFLHVNLDAEGFLHDLLVQHFRFLFSEGRTIHHFHCERILVRIVV